MKKKQQIELYLAWQMLEGISKDEFLDRYSKEWEISKARLLEAMTWVDDHGGLEHAELAMNIYNYPGVTESFATKIISNLSRCGLYTVDNILDWYELYPEEKLMNRINNIGFRTENIIRDICGLGPLEEPKPQLGAKVYLLSAFDPIANVGAVAVYKNQSYAVNALEKYRSDNPDSSVEILELRMNELREIGFLEWEGV